MRRFSFVLFDILFIVVLLICSGYAFAKDISMGDPSMGKSPIEIKADRLEYDGKRNIYKIQGNVEVTQGKRKLKADRIQVNPETKEAEAFGNVTLTEGDDILKTDRVEINLDTQVGTLYNGRLFYKRDNFYIKGKEIQKRGKDTYRVIDGEFTTCDGSSPPWKFTSKEINVNIEGYATVKHAAFYIKGLPVFYFPYLIYPIKTKRKTGFLIGG